MTQKLNSRDTQGPSHHPLSLCLGETTLCPWRAAPFLRNFPPDSNSGLRVDFFLHSPPQDPLHPQGLVSLPPAPPCSGKFALFSIESSCFIVEQRNPQYVFVEKIDIWFKE